MAHGSHALAVAAAACVLAAAAVSTQTNARELASSGIQPVEAPAAPRLRLVVSSRHQKAATVRHQTSTSEGSATPAKASARQIEAEVVCITEVVSASSIRVVVELGRCGGAGSAEATTTPGTDLADALPADLSDHLHEKFGIAKQGELKGKRAAGASAGSAGGTRNVGV